MHLCLLSSDERGANGCHFWRHVYIDEIFDENDNDNGSWLNS